MSTSLPHRRSAPAAARRERERDIVDATRALWDERGVQEAGIEDIARAVGINKALIYRHVASKDELFVLTVTRYLDELAEPPGGLNPDLSDPPASLRALCEHYADFCLRYPAFLDCALSLMRRPLPELGARVSDAVLLRLGQGMAACLGPLSRTVAAGIASGDFRAADPDLAANLLYAQVLGAMHLARVGVGVREGAGGVPEVFALEDGQVRAACVDAALALVR